MKWYTILILLITSMKMKGFVKSKAQVVPCYFIMGDSLVDNGNNNELETTAKVNYPPYGIDFPDGPTGRFTNGRNVVDFIAEFLGFDNYIPSHATVKGHEIVKGVNYGSGGAGIRDETGQQLGEVISLNKQLLNHQKTVSRMAVLLGSEKKANEYLSKCLYTIGMGNNDYINNYLIPEFYTTSQLYTPDQYASILIQQYSNQLKTLYNLGARKVAIFGVGEIGCTPAEIEIYGTDGSACVDSVNNLATIFNDKLNSLVHYLNKSLNDAKFIYLNFSIPFEDISSNGIKVVDEPCCKESCIFGQVPCSNRTEFVFWDNFHPTEISNQITASKSYNAISRLIQPLINPGIEKMHSTTEYDFQSI